MKSFFLFISISFFSFNTKEIHPMHISVTEFEYNEKTKSLEIAHKIFLDDFERHLNQLYQKNLQLDTKKEAPDADVFIKKYIAENFTFKVNKKQITPTFVGREVEDNAIWIYREIKDVKKLKSIEITNTIMLDIFDDQKNMVNFKSPQLKKSFLFKAKYISDSITF